MCCVPFKVTPLHSVTNGNKLLHELEVAKGVDQIPGSLFLSQFNQLCIVGMLGRFLD